MSAVLFDVPGPRGIAPGPDGSVWYTRQSGIGRMQPDGVNTEYVLPDGGDSADGETRE